MITFYFIASFRAAVWQQFVRLGGLPFNEFFLIWSFLSPFHPQLPLVVIILDSVVKLPRNLVKKICFWYNQFRSLTNLASINNNNRNLTATTWAMMPMKPSSLPVMQHRKDSVLMPSVSTTTPLALSISPSLAKLNNSIVNTVSRRYIMPYVYVETLGDLFLGYCAWSRYNQDKENLY